MAFATPGYRAQLRASVGPSFTSGVVANRQVLSGTVADGPTVQGATSAQVTFLVVISQRVTSVGSPSAPRSARVALVVTVTRAGPPEVAAVERL